MIKCSYILLTLFWFLIPSFSSYIPNINIRSNDDDDDINTDRFIVDSSLIPGFQSSWDDILLMHAGHIPITDKSSLFFWNFQNIQTNLTSSSISKRPLIVWLNGGPGCSSMDGALMEVGPLRVNKDSSIFWNDGWFKVADLIFIDQPIGTGFSNKDSTDDYDKNLRDSSNHLFKFIEKYFEIFKSDYDNYDSIIIAGESYAGQYIPHLARLMKDSIKFSDKLKAILLGNAWLDPTLQSLSYIPFAVDNGLIDISDEQNSEKLSNLLQIQDKCQNSRNSNLGKLKFDDNNCDSILQNFLKLFRTKDRKCINVYDISKIDSYPACGNNWPEILPETTSFLNNVNVQNALNLHDNKNPWTECNNDVYSNYHPSDDINGANLLNGLLNDGVKVNIFSGTNDLICNYMSSEMVIREHLNDYLSYNNYRIKLSSMANSPSLHHLLDKRDIDKFLMDSTWFHDDIQVGSFWQRGNLTYIKIDNASHMVAYDVSIPSIGLIELSLRDYNDDTVVDEVRTYSEKNPEEESTDIIPQDQPSQPSLSSPSSSLSSSKRFLAILFLIILLAVLAIYFFRVSTRKPKRYSALAGASKPSNYGRFAYEWVSGTASSTKKIIKKKRVHWMDLEELDPVIQMHVETEADKFKNFEMEDLKFQTNSLNGDHLLFDKPHEGSFEDEEINFDNENNNLDK